jgi:hypothetical protein
MAALRFSIGMSGVTNCWHFVISETPDVSEPGASPPNATATDPEPREKYLAMYLAVKHLTVEPRIASWLVDRDIRDFLAGRNEGEALFHALYDHVLDEPVPERLRALLKH